jgi:peroxiredoxin
MLDKKTPLLLALTATLWLAACDKKAEAPASAPKAEAPAEPAKIEADQHADGRGAAAPAQLPAATTAEIGKPAPQFTLTDEAGTEHKLEQYKGKIVVLEWTNPGCPFVVRHYDKDTMVKSLETAGKDDVVWLAIDSTKTVTADAAKQWKAKEGLPYPVLLDADGKIGKTYGAKTTPHMYVIDRDGNLAYSGAIDDDKEGKADKPRNYVIEAVEALKAGKTPEVPSTEPYGCSIKYAG